MRRHARGGGVRREIADPSTAIACRSCGYDQLLADAQFCRRCGAPTTGESLSTQAPVQLIPIPRPAQPGAGPAPFVVPRAESTDPGIIAAVGRPSPAKRPSRSVRGHRSRLKELAAEDSARITVTREQVVVIRVVLVALGFGLLIAPTGTLLMFIGLTTVLYLAAFGFRLRIFWRALHDPAEIRIDAKEAADQWEHAMPTYTILVPAFREPEVIGDVIAHLREIDYPAERLDIMLLLEADDTATIEAAEAANAPDHIRIVRVPPGEPRTKPRACNYGLAEARGKFVTIYDAEDHPEPLQLRRAVRAFRDVDDRIACLQAKLVYHNAGQNSITRWFTTEYAMLFSQLLPGLIADATPLPLGGTSNHFRRDVLDEVGGWDPWNVTEDADLGIRLHRAGYRTAVLDSVTLEEANSDFVNWIKQRSRWYKGYMQTWLVHMRRPGQLYHDLGLRGFLGFHLFVGGTPWLALVNPLFWALTAIWFISPLQFIRDLFPFWIYYPGIVCLVFGNVAFIYTNMIAARQHGRPELVVAAALSPIYWVMMSIAAVKAFVQLITAPSFWEKTTHGLDRGVGQPKAKVTDAAT